MISLFLKISFDEHSYEHVTYDVFHINLRLFANEEQDFYFYLELKIFS